MRFRLNRPRPADTVHVNPQRTSGDTRIMSERTRESRRMRLAGGVICAALVGVAMPAMMIASLWQKSLTFDEPYCVAMGHHYLTTGDTHFASRFNPPLAPVLTALPVVVLGQAYGWNPAPADPDASAHLAAARFYGQSYRSMLTASRLVVVLITALLGLGVFLWSRRLFGTPGAVLSVTLFAFAPNILAHGRLATSDMAATATFFFTVSFFRVFVRRRKWWAAAAAGLFLGLALVAKLSAVVLVPVLLVLAGVEMLLRPKPEGEPFPSRWQRAGLPALGLLLVFVLAFVVIAVAYRCEFSTDASRPSAADEVLERLARDDPRPTTLITALETLRRLPLPPRYVDCWAWLANKMRDGHESYLCGEFAKHGWLSYFPLAFAVKTTVPFPVLLVVAALLSLRLRRELFWVLFPAVAFFAVSVPSPLTIGFRHILPVMPFLFVVCGGALSTRTPTRAGHLVVAAVLVLAAWHVAESVRVSPDYLAYFNTFAGGPSGGHRYLLDSNLDWGQDVGRVEDRLRELGLEGNVHLAVFGRTDLHFVKSGYLQAGRRPTPEPGVWVVSVNELHGLYWPNDHRFAWLRDNFQPLDVIGHTIFIYRITAEDIEKLPSEDSGRAPSSIGQLAGQVAVQAQALGTLLDTQVLAHRSRKTRAAIGPVGRGL